MWMRTLGTVGIALLGCVMWLVVAMAAVDQRRRSRLLRTMKSTPTSRISNAQPGLVELVGVVSSAGKLLHAPLTGAPCVHYRVLVERSAGSGWSTVIDHKRWCDFYLDDGSGAVARLTGDVLHVKDALRVLDSQRAEAVQRFLAEQGIAATASEVAEFAWVEERIDVGSALYVLGEARAASSSPGIPLPSEARRERFVVVAPEGGELVVSLGDEAKLAAKISGQLHSEGLLVAWLAVCALGFSVWAAVRLAS